MKLTYKGVLLILTFCFALSFPGQAQDCNCDITVDPTAKYVTDGNDYDYSPGDTICIPAGNYELLRFDNWFGTEDAPLVFINCGGKVMVDKGGDGGWGIALYDNEHYRFTGTGDPDIKYGIEVTGSNTGIHAKGHNTHLEVDHVYVHDTGHGPAMFVKNDFKCDGEWVRGKYVQEDIFLHDSKFVNIGTEAFYVGSSSGRGDDCGGERQYPNELRNVRIYNNYIESVGWDGIQVGSAYGGSYIYNNTIIDWCTKDKFAHSSGIQINPGTQSEVFNNVMIGGFGAGIGSFSPGNDKYYNNVIVNSGFDGIWISDETDDGKSFEIYNNTIVGAGENGIENRGSNTSGNKYYNNLFVDITQDNIAGSADYDASNNMFFAGVGEVNFKDPSGNDYHLTESSPAINQGKNLESEGIMYDADSVKRTSNLPYDVGAYEFNIPPELQNSLNDTTVTGGAESSYHIGDDTFQDPEGDELTYNISFIGHSSLPGWVSFDAASQAITFDPLNKNSGEYYVMVIASDPSEASVSDTFKLKVASSGNDAPAVDQGINDQTANVDNQFDYTINNNAFSDPNKDPLTYEAVLSDGSELPAWLSINEESGNFSGTPGQEHLGETYNIEVTAYDLADANVSANFTITVEEHINQAPVANSINDASVEAESALDFTVNDNAFEDPENDALTYSAKLSNGDDLPGWLSFNSSNLNFSGTPSQDDINTYEITLTATDEYDASVSATFSIYVKEQTDMPGTDEPEVDGGNGAEEDQEKHPEAENIVPGIIEAEYFDMGGEGVAYNEESEEVVNDTDLRTDTDVSLEYNEGNDRYNLAYVAPGEWTEYTIDVNESANYELSVRYSIHDESGNSAFHLKLNNEKLTNLIELGATGTWGDYKEKSIDSVFLPKGEHVLTYVSENGEMNIDYFAFRNENVDTTETDEITGFETNKPAMKFYPNPFKDEIRIDKTEASINTIRLHKLTGASVNVELNDAGRYWVVNTGNLSKGIYFLQVITEDGKTISNRMIKK